MIITTFGNEIHMFISISMSIASIILAITELLLPIIFVNLINHNKNCNHILITLFNVSSCFFYSNFII